MTSVAKQPVVVVVVVDLLLHDAPYIFNRRHFILSMKHVQNDIWHCSDERSSDFLRKDSVLVSKVPLC